MQRLRWRCHSKLMQGHRAKLKYLNVTNSPSNARFSWQKSRWTGSASVSGGTQGSTGYPWRMPAENSTRETQPPETRGRRGWIDVSAARPVLTSQQTGDGDVKPHQPSDEASQQGTEAQCHVGNNASEHSRNWILSGTFSQYITITHGFSGVTYLC